ncbi:MAG: Omp28-related outer membrane protein [Saprospiraceae bacterium]|nr:Omp28-related outer membrane protein [Saprospiraceae bacterium]
MKQVLPFFLLLLLPALTDAQAVRKVLVESFTNASCPPCAAQNPAFGALVESNGTNVVLLKYQTNWPGFDPMNQQNPTEVAARVSYYGVTGVPNVRLDGAQNAGTSGSVTQAMITTRLGQATPIELELDHELSANFDSIYITGRITNVGDVAFNPGNVVLHTAITEKQITFPEPPGSTNEFDFKSVTRKMVPGSAGAPISEIAAGESVEFSYAVALPGYIYNYSRIGVVAFVQRTTDRVVYQAEESFPKPLVGDLVDVGIYPNSTGPDGLCNYSLTPQVDIANEGDGVITSMDVSYSVNGGDPVVLAWEGELEPGETVAVSFDEATIEPGVSTVTFSVANANGAAFDFNRMNETVTSEAYATLEAEAVGEDISEGLESTPLRGTPAGTLVIKDAETHLMTINRTIFANITQELGGFGQSNRSLFSDLYNWDDVGAQAHMIFQRVDLTERINNYLKFDWAHAQYPFTGFNTEDRLTVSISTDCGDSWTTVWDRAGASLATRVPATTTSRFIPTVAQWASDSISLAAFDGLDDVNVRFTVTSDYGNSLFIDNIRVNEAVISSADEPGRLTGKVSVYPNPASVSTRVEVELEAATPVTINVFDLSGKHVETLVSGTQYGAGTHQFNWAPKAQGVFLMRVATNYGVVTQRVTVVQ